MEILQSCISQYTPWIMHMVYASLLCWLHRGQLAHIIHYYITGTWIVIQFRAEPKLAPSQWETVLQSNAVSHWLSANLEAVLQLPNCSKVPLKNIGKMCTRPNNRTMSKWSTTKPCAYFMGYTQDKLSLYGQRWLFLLLKILWAAGKASLKCLIKCRTLVSPAEIKAHCLFFSACWLPSERRFRCLISFHSTVQR